MGYAKYLGAVSGATLGYVALNVPGAVAGARYGYKKGEEYENLSKNSTMPKRSYPTPTTGQRKRKLSISSGLSRVKKRLFVGKGQRKAFLKAVGPAKRAGKRRLVRRKRALKPRARKSTLSKEAYYLGKGYLNVVEQYGVIDDPNAVYLSHSTGMINNIGYTMAYSLMRFILQKAGFKISNQFQELPATNPGIGVGAPDVSDGLRFVFVTRNQVSGAYTQNRLDTADNWSYYTVIASFADLINSLIGNMRNDTPEFPYRLAVYNRDYQNLSGVSWNLGAEIYLEDMHIDMCMLSKLVLQNRSKGALSEGTSAEQLTTDRVDTQPLKGIVYEFHHADPRTRATATTAVAATNNNSMFSRMPDNGLSLVRAAQFTGAIEPLNPKYFANVARSYPISLLPGDMKTLGYTQNLKGTFVNMFRKLRADSWQIDTFKGMNGRCQMVALEEVMRTSSANLISIAYERELKIGIVFTEKRKGSVLESQVIVETVNNLTP